MPHPASFQHALFRRMRLTKSLTRHVSHRAPRALRTSFTEEVQQLLRFAFFCKEKGFSRLQRSIGEQLLA
ncbi:hypothetical protein AK812_SmicGene26155 [Symbiodinium microadriaticum]|uniref:Uncharacterized protein n=1 Tax=Symbiodinium microadriaticum TaxID=2951 RepID=A0A1Q9DA99_SYMMI|nr:hypothetical protein AK812_SmicGene26155 [Symbiodinium microadriaticum]CAE7725277.1 unnamed protein product [Symbiodinium microadriaticum]